MANQRQIQRQRGVQLLLHFQKIEEVCFKQKLTGEEQQFEVVVGSHWVQVVLSALRPGRKEFFS